MTQPARPLPKPARQTLTLPAVILRTYIGRSPTSFCVYEVWVDGEERPRWRTRLGGVPTWKARQKTAQEQERVASEIANHA